LRTACKNGISAGPLIPSFQLFQSVKRFISSDTVGILQQYLSVLLYGPGRIRGDYWIMPAQKKP